MLGVPRKTTPRRKVTVLGLNLRRLRAKLEIDQEELSEKAGVHRITITNLETGRTQGARQDTVEALAKALGVKPSELVDSEITETPVESAIEEYRRSPWAAITQPTPAEFDWLRQTPGIFWVGLKPNPKVIDHLIQAYRSGHLS